jgi:hypothetical protein
MRFVRISASSIHPIGLRGRQAASSAPTTAAGTTLAAVMDASATGLPVPGWWVRLSSKTVARPSPSVTTPSTTAATGAIRARRIVLTGMPTSFPSRSACDGATVRMRRSEIVTRLAAASDFERVSMPVADSGAGLAPIVPGGGGGDLVCAEVVEQDERVVFGGSLFGVVGDEALSGGAG